MVLFIVRGKVERSFVLNFTFNLIQYSDSRSQENEVQHKVFDIVNIQCTQPNGQDATQG